MDRESFGIVKTINALAIELAKPLVAEGVEKLEHHQMLCEIGCQFGQGYLFSKPIDPISVDQLLSVDPPWRDIVNVSEPIIVGEIAETVYEM